MQFLLDEKEVKTAPAPVQAWFAERLGQPHAQTVDDDASVEDVRAVGANSRGEVLQPVSPSQARAFLDDLHPNTHKFIEEIVKRNGRARVSEIVSAFGAHRYQDLAGAWAGTTRRMRSILKSPGAVLVTWDNSKNVFDQGKLVDSEYIMHETSVASFKTVLPKPA